MKLNREKEEEFAGTQISRKTDSTGEQGNPKEHPMKHCTARKRRRHESKGLKYRLPDGRRLVKIGETFT